MIKRLSVLNGLAILAVVLNHAAGFGQIAMFLWTNRYRPVSAPNWDQLGSLSYFVLLTLRQIATFCVPAFLFVSGFFIAYAWRGSQKGSVWKVIKKRIFTLLIPYTIWSVVAFASDFIQGIRYMPVQYLTNFLTIGAVGSYFFIPLLCYLYLLSPFILQVARSHWKLTLFVTGAIQLASIAIRYLGMFGVSFPGLDILLAVTPEWSLSFFIFFFTLGIVVGFNLQSFKEWLCRIQAIVYMLLPVTAILNVIEADRIVRINPLSWGAYATTITFDLYALMFILSFLAFDRLPIKNSIVHLGSQSLGIYLLHMLAITYTARLIYHFLPKLLANQVLLLPVLYIAGLGLPLAAMALISRSPARPTYRYLFG